MLHTKSCRFTSQVGQAERKAGKGNKSSSKLAKSLFERFRVINIVKRALGWRALLFHFLSKSEQLIPHPCWERILAVSGFLLVYVDCWIVSARKR